MIERTNYSSKEFTGYTTYTFPANQNRTSWFITLTAGTATVEYGNGGGEIPLEVNGYIEPLRVPVGEITVRTGLTADTFVVASNTLVATET